MEKHKECRDCRESKTLSAFSKDGSQKDGMCARCKICTREYFKSYSKRVRVPGSSGRKGKRAKTDLSKLLEISHVNKKLYERVAEFRLIFRAYVHAYETGKPLVDVLKDSGITMSLNMVRQVISELKKAAKNNMNLEDYLRAGRPFKAGKDTSEVLVAAKKEKEQAS